MNSILRKFSCKSCNCGISSYCKGALPDVYSTYLSCLKKQTSHKGTCKISGGVLRHWGTRESTLFLLSSSPSYILICNSSAQNVFKFYRWSCWTIPPWKTKLLLNKRMWTFSLPAHTVSQHGLCHPAIKWSKYCLCKSHDHKRGLGTFWMLYFRLLWDTQLYSKSCFCSRFSHWNKRFILP